MKYLIYILIGLIGVKVGQWLALKHRQKKSGVDKINQERQKKKAFGPDGSGPEGKRQKRRL